MSDIREQLFAAFQLECRGYLESIRATLDRAQRQGPLTPEDLETTFRQAHSLKAAARVCDLEGIAKLSQQLESLFAQVRKGARHLSPDVNAAIHLALAAIEDAVAGTAAGQTPAEPTAARQALEQILGAQGERSPASPRSRASSPKAPLTGESELDARLLAAFQIEHKEHLESIRSLLARMEQQGGAPAREDLDEAFRRAHSLKGAARLAGLPPVETLADRLESLFSRIREGTLSLDPGVIRVIHQGLDAIEDWTASPLEKRSSSAPVLALDRVLGMPPPVAADLQVCRVLAPADLEVRRHEGRPPGLETVRVSTAHLDRLLSSAGQLFTESLRQNQVTQELAHLRRQIDDLQKEWDTVRKSSAAPLRQLDTRPEFARISGYLDQVQHRVRALAGQVRAIHLRQKRSSWDLQLLGAQLQQDVRRVRLVPAESIFQGFRKMVRDLAQDQGKEVNFGISGLEIEVDRMVLEVLKDPLVHLLRNAVSHGIELPAERQNQGKNSVGQVGLHMEAGGNRLHIVVEDDGRGLDFSRVAEESRRRGLLSEAEAASSTPEELARLIFRPGFSTAVVVTGLSGRGMGLSIVAQAMNRLQGEVEWKPREGPGFSLVLSVPLSVATQRLLLIHCRGQTFAVPLHGIERLLRVRIRDVETVEGQPVLFLDDQPIPLLSLPYLLGLEGPDLAVSGDVLPVMVLRAGSKRLAAVVDGFLAERDSVIKDLDPPAARIGKLAGAILLEDGAVALVLNPVELIQTSQSPERAPILQAAEPPPEKRRAIVLVVDDSLTTRTLERSILEAHGYDVRLAVDGVEALDQLRTEPVDAVVADIQMPRMDGFTLLEEMKKDPRLARVPVIVVTSMDRREDQERGLALGANAYIVKRKFDHEELLDAIQNFI